MSTPKPIQIPAQLVKELRERTNAGFADCRAALVEAKGDIEKAISVLRKKGQAAAAKKAQRASQRRLGRQLHSCRRQNRRVSSKSIANAISSRAPMNFSKLCHDIAMHIAALDPRYVRREEVTQECLESEREIYSAQAKATGKAGTGHRKNRNRQNGKVLRRKLPLRTALHQGRKRDHRGDGRARLSPSWVRTSPSADLRVSKSAKSAAHPPRKLLRSPRRPKSLHKKCHRLSHAPAKPGRFYVCVR